MKFLSRAQCRDFSVPHGWQLDQTEITAQNSPGYEICSVKLTEVIDDGDLWFAKTIEEAIQPWTRCLAVVQETDIWPSLSNMHLYYRLRQYYSDFDIIDEKPGHLFEQLEKFDLITFIQVFLLFRWDVSLATMDNYSRITISHERIISVGMRDGQKLREFCSDIEHKTNIVLNLTKHS